MQSGFCNLAIAILMMPAFTACLLCALVVTPYFTWLPTPVLLSDLTIFYCILIFPACLSSSAWATGIGKYDLRVSQTTPWKLQR